MSHWRKTALVITLVAMSLNANDPAQEQLQTSGEKKASLAHFNRFTIGAGSAFLFLKNNLPDSPRARLATPFRPNMQDTQKRDHKEEVENGAYDFSLFTSAGREDYRRKTAQKFAPLALPSIWQAGSYLSDAYYNEENKRYNLMMGIGLGTNALLLGAGSFTIIEGFNPKSGPYAMIKSPFAKAAVLIISASTAITEAKNQVQKGNALWNTNLWQATGHYCLGGAFTVAGIAPIYLAYLDHKALIK